MVQESFVFTCIYLSVDTVHGSQHSIINVHSFIRERKKNSHARLPLFPTAAHNGDGEGGEGLGEWACIQYAGGISEKNNTVWQHVQTAAMRNASTCLPTRRQETIHKTILFLAGILSVCTD